MKKIDALDSLLLKPGAMLLSLRAANEPLDLELTPETAREIVAIMADALRTIEAGNFPPAGQRLLQARDVQPARWEETTGALNLEQRVVLDTSTANGQRVAMRLTLESAVRWAKGVLRLVEERPRRRH